MWRPLVVRSPYELFRHGRHDRIGPLMASNRTPALVVGAGKIGTAIATLLASAPDYDVTVLDRSGEFVTAYLRPDQPAVVRAVPYAANHQEEIEWEQHANATATLQREQFLYRQLSGRAHRPEDLVASFLEPPLYANAFAKGYGTLYTAVYRPTSSPGIEYLWPGLSWSLDFGAFAEGERTVHFA